MEAKAVCISDIHFNIHSIELARSSMLKAIKTANELGVPLFVCGDIHDSKANLRGECIKAMLDVYAECRTPSYTLVANHDKINEKSSEHSLEFLRKSTIIIDTPEKHEGLYFIPYHHDTDALLEHLKTIPPGSTLIMHQGIKDAAAGEYSFDKSAIPAKALDGFRVISGHYHQRQTIKCGKTGVFDYIGTPYTITYAEANDPPKGFQVLHSDGTLEFVPTNLRKHIIHEVELKDLTGIPNYVPGDLVWLKLKGPRADLLQVTKEALQNTHGIPLDCRLDLIPNEDEKIDISLVDKSESHATIIDTIIDSQVSYAPEKKQALKEIWRLLIA